MKASLLIWLKDLYSARLCSGIILISLTLIALPALAQNPIPAENALQGATDWDISNDAGDLTIQGFATEFSINTGETVHFKIDVDPAADYNIKIYRLGYYGGTGARLIKDLGTFTGTAQPDPLYDETTGRTYCTNWSESASWTAFDQGRGSNAVSGIYVAKLTNNNTLGSSHIVFIVRNDADNSDILFKTADATWQAYNAYGGNNFYSEGRNVPDFTHAVKGSYDRPFYTRGGGDWGMGGGNWLFNAEYPMLRWLERNGYYVSYTSHVDMGKTAMSITPSQHRMLMSVGHDEYWAATARENFETARENGVHLAFFSGNEVYWKTRWEDNGRTLVCYKEGTLGENTCGGKCDPLPLWTGLWRATPLAPATGTAKPENALTGQISWHPTTAAIQVPSVYKNLRFWRNTSISSMADGQTTTLPYGTLGYEMDWEQYPDYYPSGRITMSKTVEAGLTHKLSLYRYSSGALVFGAGTVQWAWGLDNYHDGGYNTSSSTDIQQATLNLLADMSVQPSTKQNDLISATASTDVTSPVSTITYPANGSSVQGNSSIIITAGATDAGGVVAGLEVSVDGGTTWNPAERSGSSWSFNWTTNDVGPTTIRTRAFDDSGNMESAVTSGNQITVTVQTPVCPCSFWNNSTVPGNPSESDPSAVELGIKFKPKVNGYITGVRFYKGSQNTGTHTGNLWTSGGVNLARAAFFNESAEGWQEVVFGSPVQVTAGTTYVASYHTTTGHYAEDGNYFAAPFSTYYLEAVQDASGNPNGVYSLSSSTSFPSTGYQASNYWVDVVFALTVGPDVNPPVVLSVTPSTGASGVNIRVNPAATFNESLDPASITLSTVQMTGPGGPVSGTVSLTGGLVTFTPASALGYSSSYTITLEGGVNGIKDITGNTLQNNYSWTFTTGTPPPPPPTEGPGGPILVISSADNPFSRYTVEILRAEGLNEFFAMDISQVTATIMNGYDVIVLGEIAVTDQFATELASWVTEGGVLIAMKPDTKLSSLLGITRTAGTLSDAYLLINTGSGPGSGIVAESMQFHSIANLYTLNGATSLALLYSNANTATSNPAVTERVVGTKGGKAYAFSYDLAKSVVYTHQGNPAWAGQKRDGAINPIRSDDMFYPDWIDFNKVAIPQADEQQRLLANIIIKGSMHRKILPRFWFLPKGLKAAVVMTGDDHGDAGMKPRFEKDILMSRAGCSVDDWECVRSTGYLFIGSTFTNADAVHYNSLGFETALHLNTNCSDFTPAQFENFTTTQMAAFSSTFNGIPAPSTNRNHCIAWSDWSSAAEIEATNGIRLDVNYYYWPNTWHLNRVGMFTGSGNPMRFAKLDGTIIDAYQVITQMQDEGQYAPMTQYPQFSDALLDNAIGPLGYYGVFCANMHFDIQDHPGANAITASAQARGIPVVSAKQMLVWLDGRNSSSFNNITWVNNKLNFTLTVGTGARNLRAMLPVNSGTAELLQISNGGSNVTYTTEIIKGINYAFFAATGGSYEATYGVDDIAPVISNVVATPHADGTATITWTTDEASTSKVSYGTSALTLDLSISGTAPVTDHSITLTGLSPVTKYYFQVTSVDDATNSASAPVTPGEGNAFTMPAGICAQDNTLSDFSSGTPGTNTVVVLDGDGAVILKPGYIEEFAGSTIPSGWASALYSGGTQPSFANGSVTVDGSHISSGISFGPGTTLEFSATFNSGAYQNVGFSSNSNFDAPWVVIGRGSTSDNNVYARVSPGTSDVLIGTGLTGAPHNYKIKWNAANFEFYVDGVLSATIPFTVTANMIIQISDFNPAGGVLSCDWIRATPYVASGNFVSRVFDAGYQKVWGEASFTTELPAGTDLQIFVRTGEVPAPDGSWTGFVQVPASGSVVALTSRFIQYRADLSTTNTLFTPVLKNISFTCTDASDHAPEITLHPASVQACDASGVNIPSSASGVPAPTVQWQVSTNNGASFTNINGATSPTLIFTAALTDHGKQYRAVWTNSGGSSTTNAGTLTIVSGITSQLEAVDASLCEGENIELKLSGSTTGLAPYIATVNGINYPVNSAGQIFTSIGTGEKIIWPSSFVPTEANKNVTDNQPVELGFKFRSSVSGYIRGIRFYNGSYNEGTYTGNLWSIGGNLLATAEFANVGTNGWQEVRFSTPVAISANTTYIASYHSPVGYFATSGPGGLTNAVLNAPLTALASGTEGPNGVFKYGQSGFPNDTRATNYNYFVDVVFSPIGNTATESVYNLTNVTDANGCSITGSPVNSVTITTDPKPRGVLTTSMSSVYEGEDQNLIFNSAGGTGPFDLVINGSAYTGITSGASFSAGTASYTPKTIWSSNDIGGSQTVDPGYTELGLRFRSAVSGIIKGIRFYKTGTNAGSFTVSLWAVGNTTSLVTANYTGDNQIGWKQVNFSTPVTIQANTTYIASYSSPLGNYYAYSSPYGFPRLNGNLTAEGGCYKQPGPGYPNSTSAANYWVDILFDDGSAGISTFGLTSITGEPGCVLTGNPISSASITVNNSNVWTGISGTAWNDVANWKDNTVPGTEPVVIPVVSNNNYPVISGAVTTGKLIINPSAGMTINGGGALTVNGDLKTTGGTFVINSTSTTNNGSLIVSGTATGSVTYNRVMPSDKYRYLSPPVGITTLPGGTYWRWNEPIGAWGENVSELPTTAASSGLGYTALASSNTISFTGSIVGSASQTATAPYNSIATRYTDERTAAGVSGGGGWNLLGNPFTSALRVSDGDANPDNDFINVNNTSFDPSYQAVYIYNGSDYTYIAKGIPGYTGHGTFSNTDVQVGQGFFVLANYNNVIFNFTPGMQTHNTTVPMTKSASAADDPWPGLLLKVKHGTDERSTLVVYNEKMTAELDPGYDVGQLSTSPDVEIYTALAANNDGVNFARQALPITGCEKNIIPVGINSAKGGEITFSASVVPLGNYKFYLEDRMTASITNLNTNTYTVTIPENTLSTGRFFIHPSENIITSIKPENTNLLTLRIWASHNEVNIEGTVSSNATAEVYDLQGRKIIDARLANAAYNKVKMPTEVKGIYIVIVKDGAKINRSKVVFL